MSQRSLPHYSGLLQGLYLLRDIDNRDALLNLTQPTLWLLGEHDPLIPKELIQALSELQPDGETRILPGAGTHAVLSHPEDTARELLAFYAHILIIHDHATFQPRPHSTTLQSRRRQLRRSGRIATRSRRPSGRTTRLDYLSAQNHSGRRRRHRYPYRKTRRTLPEAQVLALDLSIQMLQRAHTHLTRPKWPALPKALTDTFNLTRPGATCLNGDAAQLPLADDSVDLITTNLMLQWCDDLDAVFQEFRRVLRPEGLLMLTTFGPDTLKELRQAWSEVDETPHVNTFIDMHDIGDALIRNGFGQPVMDVEHFTLTYSKPMGVLRDLKAIGATNATEGRQHGLMGKQRFTRMLEAYEQFRRNGVVPATYEVIHGHAWAAQEVVKGPNRSRDGLVEISLDEFAKQTRQL